MDRPPPLTSFMQFPATAGIGLIAIAVTLFGMAGKTIDALHMNVLAFDGEPWRIWTAAFPHGGIIHLAFNVYWLWIFGTALEQTWGAVRTLAVFALFEAGATLAEYALFHGGIGLSGIGYGLFGMLAILSRRDQRFAGIVNSNTIRLFVAWYFLCIVVTVVGVMPIGNVAHTVGAVMGVLLGFALSTRGLARIASIVALPVVVIASLGGATIWRPLVNLSEYGAADSAKLGYDAYVAEKYADSIPHFRRAIEVNPDDGSSWYNLGLGLERTGDPDGALAAFRRAYKTDPKNANYRSTLAQSLEDHGMSRAQASDHAGALALFEEARAIDDKSSTWFHLSLAYGALEDGSAALAAAREAWKREQNLDHAQLLAEALVDAGAAAAIKNDLVTAAAHYAESLGVMYTENAYNRLTQTLALLKLDGPVAE